MYIEKILPPGEKIITLPEPVETTVEGIDTFFDEQDILRGRCDKTTVTGRYSILFEDGTIKTKTTALVNSDKGINMIKLIPNPNNPFRKIEVEVNA